MGAFVSVIAFLICVGATLAPTLNARPSTLPYLGMVLFSVFYFICAKSSSRYLAIIGLLLGIVGGISNHRHNLRIDAAIERMHERHRVQGNE
jgi:hypothetical protein